MLGWRSWLSGVPMLRDGVLIGVIDLFARPSSGPFSPTADRAAEDLRRPGRDRHREHAAVRGGAGEQARAAESHSSTRPRRARCSTSSVAHRPNCSRYSTPLRRVRAGLCEANDAHVFRYDGTLSSRCARQRQHRSVVEPIRRERTRLGRPRRSIAAGGPRADAPIHMPDARTMPRLCARSLQGCASR